MNYKVKIIKIINIILLISILFRFCFLITHLDHDCTNNDDCPVCNIINHYNKDLKIYKPNNIIYIISLLIIFIPIIISYNEIISNKKNKTLIGLNVELLS